MNIPSRNWTGLVLIISSFNMVKNYLSKEREKKETKMQINTASYTTRSRLKLRYWWDLKCLKLMYYNQSNKASQIAKLPELVRRIKRLLLVVNPGRLGGERTPVHSNVTSFLARDRTSLVPRVFTWMIFKMAVLNFEKWRRSWGRFWTQACPMHRPYTPYSKMVVIVVVFCFPQVAPCSLVL